MAHRNNIQGPGSAVLIYSSSPGEATSLGHERAAFLVVAQIAETIFTPPCINTMTLGMQKDARTSGDCLNRNQPMVLKKSLRTSCTDTQICMFSRVLVSTDLCVPYF